MTEPTQKQCYFKLNYIRTLLICSKMSYSCCFSLGGNLDFIDFLQKRFYNFDYWSQSYRGSMIANYDSSVVLYSIITSTQY